MRRILIPLAALAVAALVWALWPAPPPEKSAPPATAAAVTAAKSPTGVAVVRGAAVPVAPSAAVASAAAEAPPAGDLPPGAAPAPRLQPPKQELAVGVEPYKPGANPPSGNPGVGRSPGQAMPRIQNADFRQTVSRFVGGLPAGGKIDKPVLAEDVLPPAVIAGFNVPPGSRITEVDHTPASDPSGFKKLAALPEKTQSVVGFTFVTPDGKEIRDYLFVDP